MAYVLVSIGPLWSQKNNVCYANLDLFKQSLNNFIDLLESINPTQFNQMSCMKGCGMNYMLAMDSLRSLQMSIYNNKISFDKILKYRAEM